MDHVFSTLKKKIQIFSSMNIPSLNSIDLIFYMYVNYLVFLAFLKNELYEI